MNSKLVIVVGCLQVVVLSIMLGKIVRISVQDHSQQVIARSGSAKAVMASNATSLAGPVEIPNELSVSIDELPITALGRATADMFRGVWKPVAEIVYGSNYTICPRTAKLDVERHPSLRICDFDRRPTHQPSRYTATNLSDFSAEWFLSQIQEEGPILFVGDSMMRQMYYELHCLVEGELGDALEGLNTNVKFSWLSFPLPNVVQEYVQVRKIAQVPRAINTAWIDQAIQLNVSYLVFNTGAWWYGRMFWRSDWCSWESWDSLTLKDLVGLFREVMRGYLFEVFTRLRHDYDIITIWRDISPKGRTEPDSIQLNFLYSAMNKIGREVVTAAGGLVLPIWDITVPRYQDHMFEDNPNGRDEVHWCSHYGKESVPAVWVQLLSNVLFGTNHQAPVKDFQLMPSPSVGNDLDAHTMEQLYRAQRNSRSMLVPLSNSNHSLCMNCSHGIEQDSCEANRQCFWNETRDLCLSRSSKK